jgi:hypothetical protein
MRYETGTLVGQGFCRQNSHFGQADDELNVSNFGH